MKGELHVLRARLRGGIVNKARRGELEVTRPVGFVYDAAGRVGLDPDRQVQDTIRAFCTSRRARMPPSKCRVDVCRIADDSDVLSNQTMSAV